MTVVLRADGTATRTDEYSPEPWDGHSQYSAVPELRNSYRGACMLCGRDHWLFLTVAELGALKQTQCPTCGGRVLVEQAITDIGSASRAAPVRTRVRPIKTVPRPAA